MTTSYATLAQVKAQCGIPLADTQDDVLIQAALDATTTKINEKTGRLGTGFNKDSTATARYFHAVHPEFMDVDDISTAAGIIVNVGSTSQPASFTTLVDPFSIEPLPKNAAVKGRPITCLRNVYAVWPTLHYMSLQVTAIWGWPAVPATVIEAQIMWAAKLWRRKDSINGIAGQSDYGTLRVGKMDPDVEDMLADIPKAGFA